MNPLGKITDIFDHVLNFLASLASALILISWFIVCLEIVMRYFLKSPLSWVVEVTEYIMLYSTFMGAAWLLRDEGHVKVDLVFNMLKPSNKAMLDFVTSLLGMIACLIVIWYGIQSTLIQYHEGIRTFTAMLIHKWPFIMIIPFGTLLLFIQFIRRASGNWRKWMELKNTQEMR